MIFYFSLFTTIFMFASMLNWLPFHSQELYKSLPITLSKELREILGERGFGLLADTVIAEHDATGKWPNPLSEDLVRKILESYAKLFNLFARTQKQIRLFTGLFWNELYTKTKRLISTDTQKRTTTSFTRGDNYPTKKLSVYMGVSCWGGRLPVKRVFWPETYPFKT